MCRSRRIRSATSRRLMLPAVALGLPILANLSRLVRSAMLDALGQDYIRTARAKGVRERAVALQARAAQRADPLRHQRRHHRPATCSAAPSWSSRSSPFPASAG